MNFCYLALLIPPPTCQLHLDSDEAWRESGLQHHMAGGPGGGSCLLKQETGRRGRSFFPTPKTLLSGDQAEESLVQGSTRIALDGHSGYYWPTVTGMEEGEPGGRTHTMEVEVRTVPVSRAKMGAEKGRSASSLGWPELSFPWGPARFRHLLSLGLSGPERACGLWYPEDSAPTAGSARGGCFLALPPLNT